MSYLCHWGLIIILAEWFTSVIETNLPSFIVTRCKIAILLSQKVLGSACQHIDFVQRESWSMQTWHPCSNVQGVEGECYLVSGEQWAVSGNLWAVKKTKYLVIGPLVSCNHGLKDIFLGLLIRRLERTNNMNARLWMVSNKKHQYVHNYGHIYLSYTKLHRCIACRMIMEWTNLKWMMLIIMMILTIVIWTHWPMKQNMVEWYSIFTNYSANNGKGSGASSAILIVMFNLEIVNS